MTIDAVNSDTSSEALDEFSTYLACVHNYQPTQCDLMTKQREHIFPKEDSIVLLKIMFSKEFKKPPYSLPTFVRKFDTNQLSKIRSHCTYIPNNP